MNLITFYEDTYATSPVLVLVQYKTYYIIIYVMCQVKYYCIFVDTLKNSQSWSRTNIHKLKTCSPAIRRPGNIWNNKMVGRVGFEPTMFTSKGA